MKVIRFPDLRCRDLFPALGMKNQTDIRGIIIAVVVRVKSALTRLDSLTDSDIVEPWLPTIT